MIKISHHLSLRVLSASVLLGPNIASAGLMINYFRHAEAGHYVRQSGGERGISHDEWPADDVTCFSLREDGLKEFT